VETALEILDLLDEASEGGSNWLQQWSTAAADLGPNGAEPNGSQDPTQDESRARRLPAEQIAH